MDRVLVIVVTYNAMRWIDRCLGSLLASKPKPDVFVVDNASTDGTPDFLSSNFNDVIVNKPGRNLGFGQANNIGLKYALENGYSYVYLMNQDAWVFDNTIEGLVTLSKGYPEYGILSPFHLEAGQTRLDWRFQVNSCYSNNAIFNDFYSGSPAEVYPVRCVAAAHWLIPVSTLRIVGGFSPSFYHYGEDDNYADRVRWFGMKIGVAPGLKAIHDRGDREYSKNREMRISAMCVIRELSKPGVKIATSLLHAFKALCVSDVRRFHSFKPVKWFFHILSHFGGIVANKKTSEKEGESFL